MEGWGTKLSHIYHRDDKINNHYDIWKAPLIYITKYQDKEVTYL